MRVLCINQDAYPSDIEEGGKGFIRDGNVYEVIDVFFDEGYIWYVLPGEEEFGYWENCFQRLTDKKELQTEIKQLENV